MANIDNISNETVELFQLKSKEEFKELKHQKDICYYLCGFNNKSNIAFFSIKIGTVKNYQTLQNFIRGYCIDIYKRDPYYNVIECIESLMEHDHYSLKQFEDKDEMFGIYCQYGNGIYDLNYKQLVYSEADLNNMIIFKHEADIYGIFYCYIKDDNYFSKNEYLLSKGKLNMFRLN